jgi:hypothetical protein
MITGWKAVGTMRRRFLLILWALSVFAIVSWLMHAQDAHNQQVFSKVSENYLAQVPSWSRDDLEFFLHGSMSTEVIPETVLRAFIRTYPDLFPQADLGHLGLIPDAQFGWPIGFSRSKVPHLGEMSAVGVNCAACHVTDIIPRDGGTPVRVLGITSLFDAEAFFGSIITTSFRTAEPENMKRYLRNYLAGSGEVGTGKQSQMFDTKWKEQEQKIVETISRDPFGANNVAAGALHAISGSDLAVDYKRVHNADLAKLAHNHLKLFHNIRAALHIPDKPPEKAPPTSGPGRNDAFGLLSAALLGAPQPFAPVKYGLVWNVEDRTWVHWDGNTRSPLARNLLASLGLGAPMNGRHGNLDLALVQRQTELSEQIRAPRYPFRIDEAAADRGAEHFRINCASCHTGPETDERLFDVAEIGTDPARAEAFTQSQADGFNRFLAELQTSGYKAPSEPGLRATGKYWAPSLAGVWARSPYLHNGSVRTMLELLSHPEERAKTFRRGSRKYDGETMGYTDEGAYILDTTKRGNSNSGHYFGKDLTATEKRELIEYLKTL